MKIQQNHFVDGKWKTGFSAPGFAPDQAQLVLAFGDASLIAGHEAFDHIKGLFPNAQIVSCSTAGEIIGGEVHANSIVVTAIQLEKTTIKCCVTDIKQHRNSHETGKYLMKELLTDDLSTVFVISDGTHINGSELVSGLNENNPRHIPVTGGLAGDGDRFNKTFVGLNQSPQEGIIVAVGFYGTSLKMGHGSFGGWDEFGPEKTITRSEKNVLYEIDGQNALNLYKEYLGPYKDELPGSALLFPLSLKEPGSDKHVVRTILSINEHEKSMLFAGNLPQGCTVRLMKASFDKLIEGSSIAAKDSVTTLENGNPQLALMISCVGRKLILQGRTEDEVTAAKLIFTDKVPIAGFYSYGEISPFNQLTRCELHNQTMTITTLSES
jgi:hypothetical protein